MADCSSNKIDSNITGLAIAEEACLKQLPDVTPGSGLGDAAVWYALSPNKYADFGGDITTVASAPIVASRQNRKGTVTDLTASGAFNIDFEQSNLVRFLQGFFFADAREPSTTKPLNAAQIDMTSVTASTKTYALASGGASYVAGQLIFCTGFSNSSNNGIKTVASSTGTTVVVVESVVDEPSPPVDAAFQRVGFQLASGDTNVAVVGGVASLLSTALDFTTLPDLFPGKWLFIGGDATATHFSNNVGFARIKSIAAHAIVFDDTTWSAANETGTAKTIRLFSGIVIKNENTANLIKRRSYNIERTLGEGETATQAEYLVGAVPNELTVNIPQADKISADLTFSACDNVHRSGESGDEMKPGTRVPSVIGNPINTSSDIYRIKMSVHDDASSNPSALFGYVSDASLMIKNNVTPNKAVGVLGAFDNSAGNFEVGGSITAYFTTVAAVKAVRANADVGLSMIVASDNAGFLFDLPLLGLGGGRLKVEKDKPIEVPLTPAGAENSNGYTLLYEVFAYLPNVAMPQ